MNILKIVYVIILITTIQNVYAQSLQTSIQYSGVPAEVITDLRNSLHGYRAGIITIHKVPLTNRTGQEFYLSSVNGITEIKYTTQNSLENAVYTYLDLLGFRWYGPGDHWFVKPKTLPALNIPGQWMQPSFRNRSFFGTGGLEFGSKQAYDPDNQYKQKWYDWKRRNRFNADFAAVGHTGQAFYLANRNILDANPRWFAGESGKVNGRIKIEQTGAVNAYKNWIRNIYKNSKTAFTVLGVDPEDGRGGEDDPLPPRRFKGIQNWNHADKWWWLANEVAKDYPEDDKTTVVSMYAYGDGPFNALAPSFPLRKNVYPVNYSLCLSKSLPAR